MKRKIVETYRQACFGLMIVAVLFVLVEPAVSRGAEDTFTISQTVSKEISFTTPASDVVMAPTLGGLTGGTSNGGTQVVITTNSSLGYQMTLTASSSLGMIGNASSSNYIPAYAPAVGGVPDYTFTVPANKAYFGFTAEASTSADLSTSFKDATSACNATGGGDTLDQCWLNVGTSPTTIVNRSLQTPASGAKTTLKFRVVINANPNPIIPDDTYVATTTLTATVN
jgi:hypothetical protein